MKKQVIVLAALIGAASAQAQVYTTVAAGASRLSVECTGATACDTRDTGGKLFVGYSFGNGLSIEGGYMAFGKARAGNAISSTTLKPTAFVLGGAYALPLDSAWGVNVRLGVGQVKTRADFVYDTQRGSASERETKAYAGVGLTYAVSDTVKLELGLDTTQGHFAGANGTLRLISLGATFGF